MNITATWANTLLVALIPMSAALVILYSDVETLKVTKASTHEVMELKVEFTKQMTRNTTAIENLNSTLKLMREDVYVK